MDSLDKIALGYVVFAIFMVTITKFDPEILRLYILLSAFLLLLLLILMKLGNLTLKEWSEYVLSLHKVDASNLPERVALEYGDSSRVVFLRDGSSKTTRYYCALGYKFLNTNEKKLDAYSKVSMALVNHLDLNEFTIDDLMFTEEDIRSLKAEFLENSEKGYIYRWFKKYL